MKVLFITDKYYPRPLANAVCAQSLAKSFWDAGIETHMLAFQDSGIPFPKGNDGIPSFSVMPDFRQRLFYYANNFPNTASAKIAGVAGSLLSKSKKALLYHWYPLYSLSFPYRIYKKIESLNKKNHYDIVISVNNPFDGTIAGLWFKRRHSNIKWVVYNLDTIGREQYLTPQKLLKAGLYWQTKFLEFSDLFLYMKSRSEIYQNPAFDPWREKIAATDLPLVVPPKSHVTGEKYADFDPNAENWVYAGNVTQFLYDPFRAVQIFLDLPAEGQSRVFHIFGRGAEMTRLKEIERQTDGKVRCHGYVDHDTLETVLQSADVLVNLKNCNSVSGKLFEYISYRKPIIHFSGCADDPDIPAIQSYPLGLLVRTYEGSKEERSERIVHFLEEKKGLTVPMEEILSVYQMNQPGYTRDLILKRLIVSPATLEAHNEAS